jgi:homoserine dehydrogenase
MKKTINIGLCGLGTVGSGVFRLFSSNADLIAQRTGTEIVITRVATLDRYDHLGLELSRTTVTRSVDDILGDDTIDIVVELIGGTGIAKEIILRALATDRSVVTANKALLAEYSKEVFEAAYGSRGSLGFEAAVAGGIPIIRSIRQGLAGDRIQAISGIVNGTANYILSAMTHNGIDFDTALKKAKQQGYAEADPTFDIEGIDSAHKLLLLMELAYHRYFDFNQLPIEGISKIDATDIAIARELGCVIKLLACTRQSQDGFEASVHPAMVRNDSMLASVSVACNAVSLQGDFAGHIMEYGAGAGSHPTASAVAADMIEISRALIEDRSPFMLPLMVPHDQLTDGRILPLEQTESAFCLRVDLNESSAERAAVLQCLTQQQIELKSLMLRSAGDDSRPVACLVVTTEKTSEGRVKAVLPVLQSLPSVIAPVKLIRMVD